MYSRLCVARGQPGGKRMTEHGGSSLTSATADTPPLAALPASAITDLLELEEEAVSRWEPGLAAFIQEGAGTGRAVAANRSAHQRWALKSRVLVDVSRIDTTTTVLGRVLPTPVMVAPSGLHTLVHPAGELATAEGAGDAGSIMILSSGSGTEVERVTEVGAETWFQLYWGADRNRVRSIVQQAAQAGCSALVLTADMSVRPLVGSRMRAGIASVGHAKPLYIMPRSAHLTPGQWDHDARLTWRDLDWLRNITDLPIVIKGVMCGEDALMAEQSGVNAIIVSNHGGRALDTPWGTLDALPEVVDALAHRPGAPEVYVDGGFRHGAEVLVALAIGARAVLIGRPVLWGLAVAGPAGVLGVLQLLRYQLESTMAMVGATRITDLDRSTIRRVG
jgi:4-hydroxymandelate oxidase